MKYTADTSFIIGLFVREPRSAVAQEMLRLCKERKETIYVPAQVIVEAFYVLEKFYKLDRLRVADYILAILGASVFMVEKYPLFYNVVKIYIKYPAIKVGDIIIAREAANQNISKILTFDSHFETLGLTVVKDM